MKALFFTFAIGTVFLLPPTGPLRGEPPSPPDPLPVSPSVIDQLLAEGRTQNPALQAAGADADAAAAAVAAIRTWEDPTASFGLWAPVTHGFTASEEGNLVYGIDQKLPLYGRPALARKVAAAAATQAEYAADRAAQTLRRDLQVDLLSLALADRAADLAREDLGWLDATLAAVDHRYRVGQASQVDWLKIQIAHAQAADDVQSKVRERDHSAFALNRLLNRELHAPWPRVALPDLEPPLYYGPKLVAAAFAAEPQLRILRQASAAAQAQADLTRRARLPDVSVGIEARQYSGDGAFREGTATVSLSVPWLNRKQYDEDWRRDLQRKRASDFAATDYALSVEEELHHHLVDLDAARRQAVLYRDELIPLAEQMRASAEAAWERSLGPFQDLLEANRTLVADQLALAQALNTQNTDIAELCFLTGSRDVGTLVALAGDATSAPEGHRPDLRP